ncbi:MAG: hypothetical protein ABI593_10070 [Betaproteobacteria bacterium]
MRAPPTCTMGPLAIAGEPNVRGDPRAVVVAAKADCTDTEA